MYERQRISLSILLETRAAVMAPRYPGAAIDFYQQGTPLVNDGEVGGVFAWRRPACAEVELLDEGDVGGLELPRQRFFWFRAVELRSIAL
jgi:hypothetical protein